MQDKIASLCTCDLPLTVGLFLLCATLNVGI